MKKAIILLLLLSFCSSGSGSIYDEPAQSVSASTIQELIYEDADGNLVTEDLTNKKTLVVFWADY
tara:strand:+ start:44 stop:238 length:195 start_codon:yes stop_codon:yes gene_type:complete